jgi:hypothetical protein
LNIQLCSGLPTMWTALLYRGLAATSQLLGDATLFIGCTFSVLDSCSLRCLCLLPHWCEAPKRQCVFRICFTDVSQAAGRHMQCLLIESII